MTLHAADLGLYALALLALFLTPGPVWVALTARAMAGGFASAWPLALGVAVGDILWPLLAVLGVAWIVTVYGGFLELLKWVACATFLLMGALVIRHAGRPLASDSRLTRPGRLAGFLAGIAVILGNPKAILFYMGILPGFFDLGRLTVADVAVICTISFLVPLAGNLMMALFIGRARALLRSPLAIRRLNVLAGALLLAVGLVIPFS